MDSEERKRRTDERYGKRPDLVTAKDKVRDRLFCGLVLAIVGAVLVGATDAPILGWIALAAAAYYFVVAAIATGVSEGRSGD